MTIGSSEIRLRQDLQGKQMPGNAAPKIRASVYSLTGKKLPASDVTKVVASTLKRTSQEKRKVIYMKEWRLNRDEKDRLENMAFGGKSPEQLRKEQKIRKEREKSNIGWTNYQRNLEKKREEKEKKEREHMENAKVTDIESARKRRVTAAGSKSVANELIESRRGKQEAVALNRGEKALHRVLSIGGEKITHRNLGIVDREREGSQYFANQGRILAEADKAGERSTINTGKKTELAAGFGMKAQNNPIIKKEGNVLHAEFGKGNVGRPGGGQSSMRGTPPSIGLGKNL